MLTIQSHKEPIKASAEEVFNFLSDFNNFKSLLPQQVEGWQSTTDTCSFTVKGLASIALKITEKKPFEKITINAVDGTPLDFTMLFIIDKKSDASCYFMIDFLAEANSFMTMMVSKPLQNFVNVLAQKLRERYE